MVAAEFLWYIPNEDKAGHRGDGDCTNLITLFE